MVNSMCLMQWEVRFLHRRLAELGRSHENDRGDLWLPPVYQGHRCGTGEVLKG